MWIEAGDLGEEDTTAATAVLVGVVLFPDVPNWAFLQEVSEHL